MLTARFKHQLKVNNHHNYKPKFVKTQNLTTKLLLPPRKTNQFNQLTQEGLMDHF